MNLNDLSKEIHQNAVNHGFWEEKKSFGDVTALFHSEISEAFEEYREGREPTEIYYSSKNKSFLNRKQTQACNKPEGIPIELADCIIRILDYCDHEGIDIEEAIRIKHEYNQSRPYRHGGKKI